MHKKITIIEEDVVRAIEWAAAEYKFIVELKKELRQIEEDDDIDRRDKEFHKAIQLLLYISRAERRAYRFEEQVKKELSALYADFKKEKGILGVFSRKKKFIGMQMMETWLHLESHIGGDISQLQPLFEELNKLKDRINIGETRVLRWLSRYHGLLKKDVTKAQILEAVDTEDYHRRHYPKKITLMHSQFRQLIAKILQEVENIEQWVAGLEATMERAKQVLEQIDEKSKAHLEEDGWALLKELKFPIERNQEFAAFLAQRPSDLRALLEEELQAPNVSKSISVFHASTASNFVAKGLFIYWFIIKEGLVSWEILMKMFPKIIAHPEKFWNIREWWESDQMNRNISLTIINNQSWPLIVEIGVRSPHHLEGPNANNNFREIYDLSKAKVLAPEVCLAALFEMTKKDPDNQYFYLSTCLRLFGEILKSKVITINQLVETLPKITKAIGKKETDEWYGMTYNRGNKIREFNQLIIDGTISWKEFEDNVPLLFKYASYSGINVVALLMGEEKNKFDELP